MVGDSTLPASAAASYFRPMGFWRAVRGGLVGRGRRSQTQRLDYLNEALALERQGDYDAALTSYRLALRDHPTTRAFSRTWRSPHQDAPLRRGAIRHYRRALELDSSPRPARTTDWRFPAAATRRSDGRPART